MAGNISGGGTGTENADRFRFTYRRQVPHTGNRRTNPTVGRFGIEPFLVGRQPGPSGGEFQKRFRAME